MGKEHPVRIELGQVFSHPCFPKTDESTIRIYCKNKFPVKFKDVTLSVCDKKNTDFRAKDLTKSEILDLIHFLKKCLEDEE